MDWLDDLRRALAARNEKPLAFADEWKRVVGECFGLLAANVHTMVDRTWLGSSGLHPWISKSLAWQLTGVCGIGEIRNVERAMPSTGGSKFEVNTFRYDAWTFAGIDFALCEPSPSSQRERYITWSDKLTLDFDVWCQQIDYHGERMQQRAGRPAPTADVGDVPYLSIIYNEANAGSPSQLRAPAPEQWPLVRIVSPVPDITKRYHKVPVEFARDGDTDRWTFVVAIPGSWFGTGRPAGEHLLPFDMPWWAGVEARVRATQTP